MKIVKDMPVRKNIRLKGFDYSSEGCYFITLCVKEKHGMLGHIAVGDAPLRVPFCKLSEYGIFIDSQIQKIKHIYPHVLLTIILLCQTMHI